MTALPGGKVATGGIAGSVLVWDPDAPGLGPVDLGRHDSTVHAVIALPDGRVLTGGDGRRVVVWDLARERPQILQLNCSVRCLAAPPAASTEHNLFIDHQGSGLSLWAIR
jgi:hypothetical protein